MYIVFEILHEIILAYSNESLRTGKFSHHSTTDENFENAKSVTTASITLAQTRLFPKCFNIYIVLLTEFMMK